MPEEKKLASHPLFNKLLDNLRPVLDDSSSKLKELWEKAGKIRYISQTPLPEPEYYDTVVFRQAHALLDCVYRLEHIQKFIKQFPIPRTYERQGISHYSWIEYHYSYYVVTLVSLGDLSLILINTVFRLGNPEKLCKPDLIKGNQWVRRTSVSKKLKPLEKIIERHRPIRNLYIHRGQAPRLHEIFESDMLDYLSLFSFVHLYSEPIIDRELLDFAYKGEITKICHRLDTEIMEVKEAIWQLFNGVFPTYNSIAKALHK